MNSSFEKIIGSNIFKFVVGPHKKEYHIHGAAISTLSRPLDVLLNGQMREAEAKCIDWPDVDEKTFMRFAEWAYTKDYITEEPEIALDHSSVQVPASDHEAALTDNETPEKPLYSLVSYCETSKGHCCNPGCNYYGSGDNYIATSAVCPSCQGKYDTTGCANCGSVFSDCPRCGPPTNSPRASCLKASCPRYNVSWVNTRHRRVACLKCRKEYQSSCCYSCTSAFDQCPHCLVNLPPAKSSKGKNYLINKFLDDSNTNCATSTFTFMPRKNTENCEDYTGVFLCHAQLYILGDKYDIPQLRQFTLYRLHATLKEFTLYPSRMSDIEILAKYIFDNTVPEDKIREMIILYYACIVEDVSKHDGLKRLIDEIPDFALGLISIMCERLE